MALKPNSQPEVPSGSTGRSAIVRAIATITTTTTDSKRMNRSSDRRLDGAPSGAHEDANGESDPHDPVRDETARRDERGEAPLLRDRVERRPSLLPAAFRA